MGQDHQVDDPPQSALRHGESEMGGRGATLEHPADQVSEFVDVPDNEPGDHRPPGHATTAHREEDQDR